MATYDAPLYEEAFSEMEEGLKTVYVLLASDDYMFISSGDRLEALIETEGHRNLVPSAETADEAVASIRGLDEWDPELEQERGVIALRVREARRK
jgi:ASC-1-like (ASCH) protein